MVEGLRAAVRLVTVVSDVRLVLPVELRRRKNAVPRERVTLSSRA